MSKLKQKLSLKKLIKPIIFFLLIGFFVQYLWDSFDAILIELKETKLWLVITIIAMGIFYQLVEGRMVKSVVKVTKKPFRSIDGLFASCYSAFYRVITFGAGTWVAEINSYHRKGLTISQGVGVTLFRFMLFKIGSSFVALFFLITGAQYFRPQLIAIVIVCIVINLGINGIILFAAMSMTLQILFVNICNRWVKKEDWRDKVDQLNLQINSLREMTSQLVHEKKLLVEMVLLAIIKIFFWFVIPYLILKPDYSQLTLFMSLALISFVTVISGVIPTPGGVGSFEVSYMLLFQQHVSSVDAASSLLLYRLVTFMLPFLIGGVYAFVSKQKERKQLNTRVF